MFRIFEGFERIEAARQHMSGASFMGGLFGGTPDFDLLFPPEEPLEEKETGRDYCKKIEAFLRDRVDPEAIECEARIPPEVLHGLFKLGAFGMKIPKEYGGLGFSHKNYGRVLTLIASWSNSLALTVAVPQSIGVAMPLLLFGNEVQKRKYLPLVARSELSAFALTEPMTGSDAANIQTQAVLDPAGQHFTINGEKLWCTNGPIARFITLIARVPARRTAHSDETGWQPTPAGKAADDSVPTAFILEMDSPGVELKQHCRFEGCRGLENGYLAFKDVRVPAENLIGEVGKGLKYALMILNVGRAISVPAICLGMAKQAWRPTLDHANSRHTFGRPLASRHTQRLRAGRMASDLFAMEALAALIWRMADQEDYDIRIEAAMVKIFCSEKTIQFLKEAQILFGGLGYETARSKQLRGEPGFGIEQLVRDAEMYRIGEGATDILRPFVAREGLNAHLERARAYLDDSTTAWMRARELLRLCYFYIPWYFKQWHKEPLPRRWELEQPKLRDRLIYVERTSRRLSRAIFHTLLRRRSALRDDQGRQSRIEMIGSELLAIAATSLHASRRQNDGHGNENSNEWELADLYFHQARQRVDTKIRQLLRNDDQRLAQTGTKAFQNQYPALSDGIVERDLNDYD